MLPQAFKEDKDPRKMNLGVGAYRDDNSECASSSELSALALEIARRHRVSAEHLRSLITPELCLCVHSDKPVVVQSVLEASRRLHEAKLNNEYASVDRGDTSSSVAS